MRGWEGVLTTAAMAAFDWAIFGYDGFRLGTDAKGVSATSSTVAGTFTITDEATIDESTGATVCVWLTGTICGVGSSAASAGIAATMSTAAGSGVGAGSAADWTDVVWVGAAVATVSAVVSGRSMNVKPSANKETAATGMPAVIQTGKPS